MLMPSQPSAPWSSQKSGWRCTSFQLSRPELVGSRIALDHAGEFLIRSMHAKNIGNILDLWVIKAKSGGRSGLMRDDL